jgi:hypothetical protein
VPVVDRRDVGGTLALGDRDYAGVRRAEREVRVLPREVGYPGEVLRGGGLNDEFAMRQRVEECGLDCGTWLDLEEVGDLGDDRGRDDDRAAEPASGVAGGSTRRALWTCICPIRAPGLSDRPGVYIGWT